MSTSADVTENAEYRVNRDVNVSLSIDVNADVGVAANLGASPEAVPVTSTAKGMDTNACAHEDDRECVTADVSVC